jgi:serine/threonine protein kinase
MQIKLPNTAFAGGAHGFGGFADVFRCIHQDKTLAVKVLRTCTIDDQRKVAYVSGIMISPYALALTLTAQRYLKEAIMWNFLRHPNVLPLCGILMDSSRSLFAMVSEWMTNGNINFYVKGRLSGPLYP